jgi:hypothetical protein
MSFLLRLALIVIGLGSAAWGWVATPFLLQSSTVARAAGQIGGGERFGPDALIVLAKTADQVLAQDYCHPAAIRAASVVRFEVLDRAFDAGATEAIDREMERAKDATEKALACVPSDPMLWLIRYRLSTIQGRFDDRVLQSLRLSYEFGPNEVYVMLPRSRLAFITFEYLPADLQAYAERELASLLRSGLYNEVAAILQRAAWPVRDRAMSRFDTVPARHREALANIFYNRGLDVKVPGVADIERRPWH